MEIGKLERESKALASAKPSTPVVTLERNQATGEDVIMVVDTAEGILTHCYTGSTSSPDTLGTHST